MFLKSHTAWVLTALLAAAWHSTCLAGPDKFSILGQITSLHLQMHDPAKVKEKDRLYAVREQLACQLILQFRPQNLNKMLPLKGAHGLFVTSDLLNTFGVPESAEQSVSVEKLAELIRTLSPRTVEGQEVLRDTELSSSQVYADLIQKKADEKLLLLPAIHSRNVPGFDGVIYDAKMKPVANYSLKNVADQSISQNLFWAIEKSERYSRVSEWLPWSDHSPFDSILRTSELNRIFGMNRTQVKQAVLESSQWLSQVMHYFGVGGPELKNSYAARPYRIVINVLDHHRTKAREADFFDRIQEVIQQSNQRIQSVTFILGDEIFEITAQDFEVYSQ